MPQVGANAAGSGAAALERLRGSGEADDCTPSSDGEEEELPLIMGKDDPRRMELTMEEWEWAINIKGSVETNPDLDNLSDFMYAQLALICKDNTEAALKRIVALQDFRREYGIKETQEEACRAVNRYIELFPNSYLAFGFSKDDGAYMTAYDFSKFDTSAIDSPKRVNELFVGGYYIHHVMCPDLATVRKGSVFLMECGGVKWNHKPDIKLAVLLYQQLVSVYPCQNKLKHYHTGVIFKVLSSLLKRALPEDQKHRFESGLVLDQPLDVMCLVPTPEAAEKRTLHNMQEALKRRYENEKYFSLDFDF